MKFQDWFMKWFELYREDGLRQVTINKYLIDHKRLKAHAIGQLDIKKITREDAQKYINDYGEHRSKVTVEDHHHKLKSCFGDALMDGLVKTNPFAKVKLTYKEQKLTFVEAKSLREKKKWLEVDEYERLKKFLINWLNQALIKNPFTFQGNRGKAIKAQVNMMIIFVALKSGMRYSEILGLTRDDINYKTNEIVVNKTWDYKKIENGNFVDTKNHASMRNIIVDSETIEMVIKFVNWLDSMNMEMQHNTLFNELSTEHYNSTINSLLETLLNSLGIESISLHKLRHTQASYLLAKGVSIQVVAKRLGHTDTTMVRTTYGHLLAETEDAANKQIVSLL